MNSLNSKVIEALNNYLTKIFSGEIKIQSFNSNIILKTIEFKIKHNLELSTKLTKAPLHHKLLHRELTDQVLYLLHFQKHGLL